MVYNEKKRKERSAQRCIQTMARKNFGPNSFITPEPVLMIAAYDENGTPDIMNAAWGGISSANQISMCISPGHKTVKNILVKKAFTVSFATLDKVVESDYVGIVSANEVPDKFARAGFTATKSEYVDAPLVDQYPVALECEFVEYQSNEYGVGVIGRVVNVTADERVMTDGRVDMTKVDAIAFDPYTHGYYRVSERVGEAFRDGLKLKK